MGNKVVLVLMKGESIYKRFEATRAKLEANVVDVRWVDSPDHKSRKRPRKMYLVIRNGKDFVDAIPEDQVERWIEGVEKP
jgi:hypothetical protein